MTNKKLAAYGGHKAVQSMSVRDIQKLDLFFYAFGVVEEDGTLTLSHPEDFQLFAAFRQLNPGLKILLSIGGGGQNGLSRATADEGSCRRLATRLVTQMQANGFDGLDLDWEFPTVGGDLTERDRHTHLLGMLRQALDGCPGDRRLLTIAAPSGEWCFQVLDLERSVAYLDFVNLMTYDMASARGVTCHHTAARRQRHSAVADASAADNIDIMLRHGIPREKLLIGGAFYSRKWTDLPDKNHGLFLPVDGPSDYGPGYSELVRRYVNRNGFTRYWDEEAQAPYLFDGHTFLTYDDPVSLKCKCRLVRDKQIAGIVVWEYGYDEEHVLIAPMRDWLDA